MAKRNAARNGGDSRQNQSSAQHRAAHGAQNGTQNYARVNYGSSSRAPRSGHQQPSAKSGMPASQVNPYSRNNPAYSVKATKRMGTGKKVAITLCCVILVALIGCGTAFALFVSSVDQQLKGSKTEEEQLAIQEKLVPTTTFDEPFYMLLIGSDARADDEGMGARSDTNIVVRVDAKNNQATMISIPRDTMIQIDGYGTNKFNAAYTYGNVAGVIEEANDLLDVKISHYAEVNFESLIELVDVVGGVDVEVPERIDDPDAGDIVIEAGPQHLDGEAALVFARSRAYADGDFTRASNQRLLIEGLVNKVLSLPITDLPGVIQSAAKCVTTDLTTADIYSLATQFKNMGDLVMYSCMVPSTTGYVDGVSYVFADTEGLSRVMQVVEQGGDPNTVVTSGAMRSALEQAPAANTEPSSANGQAGSASPVPANNGSPS